MELTAEQQEKIKGFAERYFCKDENIKVLSFNNLNDDVLIQLNRKKALFSFSPYDINKFAKDIYILGFQINLIVGELKEDSSLDKEVAKKLGITTTTLYMYINGDGSAKEVALKILNNK